MTWLPRLFVLVCAAAIVGILVAISMPVRMYARMETHERLAAAWLMRIADAQRAFRERAGRRGYATDLASLTTPCPGDAQPALALDASSVEYDVVLRAARGAVPAGADCHGRPLASDYYVSAEPKSDVSGRQALAMTSRARIHVFFDGIAPREPDFGPRGLAVPLDRLSTFKIP